MFGGLQTQQGIEIMIGRRRVLGTFAGGLAGFAGGVPLAWAAHAPARLYFGGDVITMEGDRPIYAQAVVEQYGRIAFVGSLPEARARFAGAVPHDLQGRTLLPGFIDGHGHMYTAGFFSLLAGVLPPPDGPGGDLDSLVETTRKWIDSEAGKLFIGAFGWVVAAGYDDSQLREKAHPTAQVLDRITTDLPVLIIHQSGHLGVLNTRGLAEAGITRETQDPPGGVIRRDHLGEADGVLEESAFMMVAGKMLGRTNAAIEQASVAGGQALYSRWGYTTAQEGRAMANMSAALGRAAEAGQLSIDVVCYPDIAVNSASIDGTFYNPQHRYTNRYRIGGAKLSLDGSPQGKTAWLTSAYHQPSEGMGADYRGYPAMPDAKANALTAQAVDARWQLLCHSNGDAAIDQFIGAMDKALGANGYADHRSVLIHGQTLRKDQVAELARMQIMPSLFPAHTFYWGDYHQQSVLGDPRAQRISPGRDVLRSGLMMTSHHDAPVVVPNPMRILDATVNRTTRTGVVLGPDQRLTPYEGLRALTAWAAFQHFEETTKGTLSVGKLADMVLLSDNPLKVPPQGIHQIAVLETFKEGRSLNHLLAMTHKS
jgi:predicted amidohydrolase YtcJ